MKQSLLYISAALNIILILVLFNAWNEEPAFNEELFKSKGRVEELEVLLDKNQLQKDSLSKIRDSLSILLKQKPVQRVIIVNEYGEKIDSITSLPLNNSLQYLTARLSEVTLD
jgi:hypothetical protein